MTKSIWMNRVSPMEHTDMVDLLLRFTVLLLAPIIGASATCLNTYEVGGPDHLWMVNTSDPLFYVNWAAGITFYPGDCLQFNRRPVAANVDELSASDYETCSLSNPQYSWHGAPSVNQTVDPFPVQSSYPVSFYFASSLYCALGMKFAATVSDPSSTLPPTSTNSSSDTGPPGTPSGTSPATNSGWTTPSSTLAAVAPSSAPFKLSIGAIAGVVAAGAAALTGGAGVAYNLNIKFHQNSSPKNEIAANGGSNGVHNGAGYGVHNGVGHGVHNGAGYGIHNGAAYGVHNGFGHGVGSRAWV